jgi:primosomal protein N' (replication factor Y)
MDKPLDYALPPELVEVVKLGSRVRVPLGRASSVGYVIEFPERSEFSNLKSVQACLDAEPVVAPEMMKLAGWMADYYAAPVELAVRAVLPVAVRREGAKAKVRPGAVLVSAPDAERIAKLERRAPKQVAALKALMAAGTGVVLPVADVGGGGVVAALERDGWVKRTDLQCERDPFASMPVVPSAPLSMNEEQKAALAVIEEEVAAGAKAKAILLQGVTGSGKTEIYLQAIARVIERGAGAIVLVPEIALTPQSVERFRARFEHLGVGVAVLHSGLSSGERYDQWHRIRDGRARVVVGPRSAVFAPVRPLGLIVVDEEHEPSYKQQEAPRYHARDVAVMRGYLEGVPVVLGTATPSLESLVNVQRDKYRLATLTARVDSQAMPRIWIVDMRYEVMHSGGNPLISRRLKDAILERLERSEQTILFLNRRGFASSLQCAACGHVVMCERCSVPMTYHRSRKLLVCHWCSATRALPTKCPSCGVEPMRQVGAGTERIEHVLQTLFPKARILRMDSDTMRQRHDYERALGEFRLGRCDILLGTQMIAKGLHFPNVTLVGIIQADMALHLPDFRASERVFQLLTQVAGRAGRGEREGDVVVQTYTPHHSAIQYARHHDSAGFAEEELEIRKQCGYPPYCRLVLIHVRSKNQEQAARVAGEIALHFKELTLGRAEVSEGLPAPIEKIEDYFRFQVLVRTRSAMGIAAPLRALVGKRWPGDTQVTVDVDAHQLL